MMNSAAFGGIGARAALEKAMFDPELNHIDTDWCAHGEGCVDWQSTEEGKSRRSDLINRLRKWGKEHPEEFAKLMEAQNE